MAEQGVYLRDVNSLCELNNHLQFAAEAMANIEDNVSGYINGVKDVLEHQLSILRERLEKAQEQLSRAEDALSRCEASQHYDDESGTYIPSCSWEEREVRAARQEVERCQRQYDEGKRIVDECEREISDYNTIGGLAIPPGGHHLILNMVQSQTVRATGQLREYIGDANEVLKQDVGGNGNSVEQITNENIQSDDIPLSADERYDIFRQNINGIKQEQADLSSKYEIKDANRAMRCPTCGKPQAICTCKNLHINVNLYE